MSATNTTFLPRKNSQTKAEELARLDKIVENSSEKNRNFFIAYLSLMIYVQAIIFSTTDLQLLVSTDGLKLPLIDLNVPLVGFYVVVPIFIIALHFNFLQNLESHHYKLMQWQAAHMGGQVSRKFIYPFLFDYAILEQGSQFQRLVKIANSLLCYNLAPITLGLLLIRFSDTQDWLVTVWHYFAFLFDCGLVWLFHRALQNNQTTKSEYPKQLNFIFSSVRFLTMGFVYGLRRLFGVLLLAEMIAIFAISGTNNDDFVNHILPKINLITLKDSLVASDFSINLLGRSFSLIEVLLPRISINPNEKIWQPNIQTLKDEAILIGKKDWLNYFKENGEGFQFETKSLRLAELAYQYLPRAKLNGIKLQGANLEGINLQGARLFMTQLQHANLKDAQLENVFAIRASFQGATLWSARMQGANLYSVNFANTDLFFAQLQGSKLSFSNIKDANVIFLDLQGADLSNTKLDDQLSGGPGLNMQGTIFYETTVSNKNPPSRPILVFAKAGKENMFYSWKHRLNASFSKTDEEKKDDLEKYGKYFRHAPDELAKPALVSICKDDHLGRENTVTSTNAFRRRYRMLQFDPDIRSEVDLKHNSEYQNLLIDIDQKLCTLPECAKIRDDINSLDCKPYLTPKK